MPSRLIFATPTGSSAYNLSAGGSLVHSAAAVTSITPICAHSLSFRPLVVPSKAIVEIKVSYFYVLIRLL